MHFVTTNIYQSSGWRLALRSRTFDRFIGCADGCQKEDDTNRVAQRAKNSIDQPKDLWQDKENDDKAGKDKKGINHQAPKRHSKPLRKRPSLRKKSLLCAAATRCKRGLSDG